MLELIIITDRKSAFRLPLGSRSRSHSLVHSKPEPICSCENTTNHHKKQQILQYSPRNTTGKPLRFRSDRSNGWRTWSRGRPIDCSSEVGTCCLEFSPNNKKSVISKDVNGLNKMMGKSVFLKIFGDSPVNRVLDFLIVFD